MSTIKEKLRSLQVDQHVHDELYHREIACLNNHQRIKHLTLHFAKYAGKICDFTLNGKSDQDLKKTIVDAFIISVSCSSILHVNLSYELIGSDDRKYSDLLAVGNDMAAQMNIITNDPLWLVKTLTVAVGELAKACEAIDHLEAFPFRERIVECVVRISSLMVIAAANLDIDLIDAVPIRLLEIEKKSIFYEHHMRSQAAKQSIDSEQSFSLRHGA